MKNVRFYNKRYEIVQNWDDFIKHEHFRTNLSLFDLESLVLFLGKHSQQCLFIYITIVTLFIEHSFYLYFITHIILINIRFIYITLSICIILHYRLHSPCYFALLIRKFTPSSISSLAISAFLIFSHISILAISIIFQHFPFNMSATYRHTVHFIFYITKVVE